jgi:hypothetical protein
MRYNVRNFSNVYQKKYSVADYVKLDSVNIDTNLFKEKLRLMNKYDEFEKGTLSKSDINIAIEESKIITRYGRPGGSHISPRPIWLSDSITRIASSHREEILTTISAEPDITPPGKGNLTYVIKDTMEIDKTYTVDLSLSKDMNQEQIISIIDGFKNKQLIDTLINITPIMRARLLDPTGKNFTITVITDEIQNTTNVNLVRWQWQIVPLVEGDNYLTISVDNYVDNKPQSVNIYNGKTYVFAIHTWYGDLWNWIAKYWTYITYVVGGIFAILAWLYKERIIKIFKKKKDVG